MLYVALQPGKRISGDTDQMPNIKSAKKRMRTAEKSRQRNRAVRSSVNTARRRVAEAIETGDKAKSETLYREYCSALDKAAKTGRIKANTASRRKSRLGKQLASMGTAA